MAETFILLWPAGDQTTRPQQNAISAVAWTQTQVMNLNSKTGVQDPPGGGVQGVSVQGVSIQGGLCLGGLCLC